MQEVIGGYEEQDFKDIWGVIKTEVSKGWFVPSREELSAFAQELEINETNYLEKGLRSDYWSSTQVLESSASYATFSLGRMSSSEVYGISYIRLSTTF